MHKLFLLIFTMRISILIIAGLSLMACKREVIIETQSNGLPKITKTYRYSLSRKQLIEKKIFNSMNNLESRVQFIGLDTSKEERNYYENGNLKSIFNYKNDTLFGLFSIYYENGNIFREGFYLNGIEDSIWNEYLNNGQLLSTYKFKNGFVFYDSVNYEYTIEFENNIDTLQLFSKYRLKIQILGFPSYYIVAINTNGRIIPSNSPEYNFIVEPSRPGKLTIRVHSGLDKELIGEREFYVVK